MTMQKLSGSISLLFLVILAIMFYFGSRPPAQTLMDLQELPDKGANLFVCETNDDCIAIRESCCDCKESGQRTAISKKYYKHQLDEKSDSCMLASCGEGISQHPSCQGAKPTCVNGQCQMQ